MLFVTACGSRGMMVSDRTHEMATKFAKPDKDRIGLYIYTEGDKEAPIYINAVPVGVIDSKTYIYKELEPGDYVLAYGKLASHHINLRTKGGNLYFIRGSYHSSNTVPYRLHLSNKTDTEFIIRHNHVAKTGPDVAPLRWSGSIAEEGH